MIMVWIYLLTNTGYIMEFRNSGKMIFYIILNKEVLQLNTDLLGGFWKTCYVFVIWIIKSPAGVSVVAV